MYDIIKNKTKEDFLNIAERLRGCAKTEGIRGKIDKAAGYIASNWTAAKYQKEEVALAAGAEEIVSSATKVLRSEKTKRTKELQTYAKYSESMRGSISTQSSKRLIFQLKGKI